MATAGCLVETAGDATRTTTPPPPPALDDPYSWLPCEGQLRSEFGRPTYVEPRRLHDHVTADAWRVVPHPADYLVEGVFDVDYADVPGLLTFGESAAVATAVVAFGDGADPGGTLAEKGFESVTEGGERPLPGGWEFVRGEVSGVPLSGGREDGTLAVGVDGSTVVATFSPESFTARELLDYAGVATVLSHRGETVVYRETADFRDATVSFLEDRTGQFERVHPLGDGTHVAAESAAYDGDRVTVSHIRVSIENEASTRTAALSVREYHG